MNMNDLQTLVNIHNTLLNIETKGENTIYLAQCLVSLKSFVEEKAKELKQNNETSQIKEED